MNISGWIFFAFLTTSTFEVFSQKYFEGTIVYSTKEFDELGKPIMSFVDKERVFYSKDVILIRAISGPQIFMFGKIDVYIDSRKFLRYSIDHSNDLIKNISNPLDIENIDPLEEREIGEDKVSGYICEVRFLKYVHKFEGPGGITSDTISCTYYNSKNLKIFQPSVFGSLQGNRNTLLIDGRYSGVPLKVILRRQQGSYIVIESEEIKEVDVSEFIKLPNYTFVK